MSWFAAVETESFVIFPVEAATAAVVESFENAAA
jgi:hypothetical protein